MSSNIEIIGEWIKKETSFFGRTDELFITTFLEACDNDVEKTKRRIVRYYELRRLYPRLMRNRDCLDERQVKLLRQKVIYSDFLKETYELPVVLTIKASRLENDDNMFDAFRGMIFTVETGILESARFRKYGGIGIFDLENIKITQALQITPNLVMQAMKCLFEGVPFKCQALLFINAGSMLRAAISVGSLFLPTAIRNIITITSGSWDSIRDKVSPQSLPIEYGGTNGTLEESFEPGRAALLRWRDYLLDDEQYGFNDNEKES